MRDAAWTYVGHHRALRAAGGRLEGLWIPAGGRRLHRALRSAGHGPVLPGRVGQDGGYAQLHLEVQEVIPGVLNKQVLGRQRVREAPCPAGRT